MSDLVTAAPRRHDPVELLAGLLVLLALAGLIVLAVTNSGRRTSSGYSVSAQFDHIDGLDVGSDVRLAGVRVGQVIGETVNPGNFQAVVTMNLRADIKLPADSSVVVTSDSLLGGKYLALSPGGSPQIIPANGQITQTQGAISLEQLLSKFIFSVTDQVSKKQPATPGTAAAAPVGKPDDLPKP